MNYFGLIVRKELRETISTMKFVVTFSVGSILILLAFLAGAGNYRASVARYEAVKTQELRKLDGVTDWLAVRDYRVFLPPQPLASLVSGIANDIGRTVEIQGRGEVAGTDSRYGEEPALAAFRMLDLEFVLQIVLSLFGILFAYDAVNGEKEGGTLKLIFAGPVPRRVFITAKILGRYLAVTIPLLIPLLSGAAILPLLGIHLSPSEWIRFAFIILAALLFCGVYLVLSLTVSAFTHRSSNAFLALLVLWVVIGLIVPRLSVVFAGGAVDVLSVDEIAAQKSRLAMQLWTENLDRTSLFKPTSTGSPDSMMQEFQSFMGKLADDRDKKMRELSSRLGEERANGVRRQEAVALGLARLSPAALFSLASSTLAGTSLSMENSFLQAAGAYQQEFGRFLLAKTGINPGGSMVIRRMRPGDAPPKPINPQELPEFRYEAGGTGTILAEAGTNLALLLALNAGLFCVAVWKFLRYDVR